MERFEHLGRNLKAGVAVLGGSLLALAAPELATAEPVAGLVTPHGLERPAPSFKTGEYEGFTSQPCTAEAAADELCVEGEKIPISLTANKGKIVDVKTAVTTTCWDGADKVGNMTFPLVLKSIKMNARHEFSGAQLKEPGTVQKAVTGTMRGTEAEGGLGFSISINGKGEPKTDGDFYCGSDFIDFEAERVEQP